MQSTIILGMSPLRIAVIAQAFGWIVAAALIRIAYPPLGAYPYLAASAQGLCAALISHKLEAPPWWLPIHLVFPPSIVAALALHLPPTAWLAGFTGLALIYWRVDRSRVPLYLSNATTADHVAQLLGSPPCTALDAGCGSGGLLLRLARLRPDCTFVGVEHAPLPWLVARLRALVLANVDIRYGDFWREPLGAYGLVYAFLSPAPMSALWLKAEKEMDSQALLVSNSFPIPGRTPDAVIDVPDARRTRLLCYRPGTAK